MEELGEREGGIRPNSLDPTTNYKENTEDRGTGLLHDRVEVNKIKTVGNLHRKTDQVSSTNKLQGKNEIKWKF